MVATAYMEEAMRYDWLVAMYAGKVLATGSPQELIQKAGVATLEEAFIDLLPPEKRAGHQAVQIPPRKEGEAAEIAIEARDLTKHFGDFVAVDHVNFKIGRGEIFGFLGANGCGKSTTMRMLTGLLPPTEGQALLFGRQLDPNDLATRRRVGYMSQAFSLYTELTVQQNLELHAKLFSLPSDKIPSRVDEMAQRFGLTEIMDALPDSLPLGVRQRLQLAVAMIHGPDLLVLDEPTSGVDPVARDSFWQSIIDLSRNDQVTIFITTHFMNEAMRCDRISLMNAGRVLVSDTPANVIKNRGSATLEEAFISYLEEDQKARALSRAPAGPAKPVAGSFTRRQPPSHDAPNPRNRRTGRGRLSAGEVPVMELKALAFLLTDRCNASCGMCCFSCSPRNRALLDVSMVKDYIRQAAELGTVKSVSFSGGEAMLYYDQLRECVAFAKAHGLRSTLVSNGFWGCGHGKGAGDAGRTG